MVIHKIGYWLITGSPYTGQPVFDLYRPSPVKVGSCHQVNPGHKTGAIWSNGTLFVDNILEFCGQLGAYHHDPRTVLKRYGFRPVVFAVAACQQVSDLRLQTDFTSAGFTSIRDFFLYWRPLYDPHDERLSPLARVLYWHDYLMNCRPVARYQAWQVRITYPAAGREV